MEKSVEEAAATMDHRSPSTRVRRRLVQSTLFPHRPQDNVATEAEDCDKDEDHEDEEEEYCGSQTKKRRQQKPKAAAKSRVSKKVSVKSKETQSKGMDDEDSPVIGKPNFFLKVSERRQQKRQQKEQLCVGSSEEYDKTCSPETKEMKSPWQRKLRASTTPEKRQMNTTPKKKVMSTGLNEACSGQMLNNLIQSEHTSQLIPDLRLEARMTAEENSRIFGGRQIHPFFSSWNMSKKNQETTDEESSLSLLVRKDKSTSFSPIHVFEKVQDDDFSLDWGKWGFTERSCESTSCGLESERSSIYEGAVKSLQFDNFLDISHSTGTSSCQNDGSSDQCPIQLKEVSLHHSPIQRDSFPAISSTLLTDEQVVHCERSREREVDHEMSKIDSFAVQSCCGRNSDVKCHDIFLEERMMSYGHGCGNQPANSLWTNKYQPGKAIEVCGNGECVNFLNEWLHLWHEKDFRTSKNSNNGNICFAKDVYNNCYTEESDSEDMNEAGCLKNVLLVTGPVGSGKSAAIYACAKEQGFQVIEVNASDWRNGALVKQRFREAVESHWRQCSTENPETSDIKHFFKSFPASCNATAAQGSENQVIELVPLSDDGDTHNARMTPWKSVCKENRTVSDQSGIKTLILFEDVDATLYEDRGFLDTIHQLAETAKRPMILTSNSNDPVLPNNLDRLKLCFTIPSVKELLPLVNMVCAAEKANIQPCLVERFIGFCQGDIRKTILHLQFWCQGKSSQKDKEVQSAYGPVVFDPDAGHRILPKIISCGYPSQLSEIVEKEITKTLLEVEETSSLTEVVEEEELDNNDLLTHKIEPNSIEAKKEAMLSRHCSDQDGNELAAQFDTACEFSNSSGSPVAFSRQSVKRRTETVLSSDSEEECFSDIFPVIPGKLFEDMDNEVPLEVINKALSHCLATEMSFNPLTEQLLHSQGGKSGENYYPCSVTADCSHVNGMCKSVDVSCVPESSFVPETELFSEAVSCGDVGNAAETAYANDDFPVNGINLNISPSELYESPVLLRSNYDTESVQEGEEVADYRNNSAETAFTKNHFPIGGINLNIPPSGLHEIPILLRNSYDTQSVQQEREVADCLNNSVETAFIKNDFSIGGIDLNISPSGLHEIPILLRNSCDIITESVQEEEVADSHIECVEAVPREYQGMDECSRMNFSRRSKFKKKPRSFLASDYVQETWRKLRHCHMDLQQYATLEHKDASKVLSLAYGMSNLISEADMLLSDCQLQDYLEPSMVPCENSHSFSWCDDQLKMVSTISEHGMCLFAKDIVAVNSNMVPASIVDLAWEMVTSSTNTTALGKLVSQDKRRIQCLEMDPPKSCIFSQSDLASSLCSIVQSIIPSRSYLSIKGEAFHEYLSSLSQISRSEASRLSESLNKSRKRRVRVARNYLSTGALSLTSKDISLLGQYNCYQKISMDASFEIESSINENKHSIQPNLLIYMDEVAVAQRSCHHGAQRKNRGNFFVNLIELHLYC